MSTDRTPPAGSRRKRRRHKAGQLAARRLTLDTSHGPVTIGAVSQRGLYVVEIELPPGIDISQPPPVDFQPEKNSGNSALS